MSNLNPFPINEYLKPKYICSRNKETSEIIKLLHKGENIQIQARDGLGKTTLVKNVIYKLEKESEFFTIYFDALNIYSPHQFLFKFYGLLVEHLKKKIGKKKSKVLKDVLDQNKLNSFTNEELVSEIKKLVPMLEFLKKSTIIAIDNLYYLQKKIVDEIENSVVDLFSNSDKVIFVIAGMTNDNFSGFTNFKLFPIPREKYSKFILAQFKNDGIKISDKLISHILNWSKIDFFTTQLICNRLWKLQKKNIKKQHIEDVFNEIVTEYETVIKSTRNLLTEIQWKLFLVIALNEEGVQLTSLAVINKYSLNAPSSVNTALKALLDKKLIYKDKFYKVSDVLLVKCLEKLG